MSDAYQDAVTKLMAYLDQTADFAKGQLPEVAHEMLVYGAFYAHFWMWFWIVLASLSLVAWVATIIKGDDGAPVAIMFLVMVACSVFSGVEFMELRKIEMAPKLYVMDELAERLKSATK